jgi:hypothetical protein
MNNTTIALTGTTQNPDTASIINKKTIDISVSLADISASNYTGSRSVGLNYSNTEIQVYVSSSASANATYYVPVYAEKINYNIWKQTINKSFQELGNL